MLKTFFKKPYVITVLLGLTGITLTLLIGWHFEIRMPVLTGDVFLIAKAPPVIGFLSNLGAFVWFGTFSIILFTLASVSNTSARLVVPYLIASAALTFFLFVDDFFMFHDFWLRRFVGPVDIVFYGVLGSFTALYLFVFRRLILITAPVSLAVALAFFALSIVLDVFQEPTTDLLGQWQYLVEDAVKWMGICFWACHFWIVGQLLVRANAIIGKA